MVHRENCGESSNQGSQYEALVQTISQIGSTATATHMDSLRRCFSLHINSRRDIDRISTVRQLIHILEKRSTLHQNDVEALILIGRLIDREDVVYMHVQQYKKIYLPGEANALAQQPRPAQQPIPANNTSPSYSIPDEIKRYLSRNIIRKWTGFARRLDLTEADLDIVKECSQCGEKRMLEVLRQFEEQMRGRQSAPIPKLLEALREFGRKDLEKEVQAMIFKSL